MIYAYTLPDVPYKKGWTKIGYTEQDVEKRIDQQTKTAGLHWQEEWRGNALYEDGTGKAFHDKDFHAYLRSKGIKQQKDEQGEEWFNISGSDSQRMFFDFKTRKDEKKQQEVIPYTLRKEQAEAVSQAKAYFNDNLHGEFLWNAKPRFGKTLSVYDLSKEMKAEKVLIVTNRPAIANSWHSDYCKFLGVESGYRFVSETQSLKGKPLVYSRAEYESEKKADPGVKCITFLSLQDLKGSIYFGGNFDKLRYIKNEKWDLLVIDEAHEGVDTSKTDVAFDHIERKWTLHLSGTPFKAMANSKFPDKAIYNWTYADEQKAKETWKGEPGTINPYETLPRLAMYTYQMSEIALGEAERGIDIEGDVEAYAFDLNEFFLTDERGAFKHEAAVNRFIDALVSQGKFPFSTPELRNELKHTLWMLNRVDSAKALANKLKRHPVFGKYEIVLAAGDGKLDSDDEKIKAFDKVTKAIQEHDYTITLTVGQLTVGVTVPEWTAVLMLSSISSPALYMQAAFRAQNPCMFNEGGKYYRKDTAYVFDFDPARTLDIYETFANELSPDTANGKGDVGLRKAHVSELLNFFAVIGEDENGEMVELDAEKVLSIPRKIRSREVVRHGFMSDFLFQNITNVFHAPAAVIELINKFDSVKDNGPINPEAEEILLDDNGNIDIGDERIIGLSADLFGDKIYKMDEETIEDIIQQVEEATRPSERDEQLNRLMDTFKVGIAEPMLKTAKERYGSELSASAQKTLERKINLNAKNELEKIAGEYKINQKTLDADFTRELDQVRTEKEKQIVVEKYDKKRSEAVEAFKKEISDKVDALVQDSGKEIVNKVMTDKEEKKKREISDEIRNHLRGFSRTIPSFLMAYGGDFEVTLANFDSIIPDQVFKDVTSITKEEFRILRDGGMVLNEETGKEEEFGGHLFDEVVFNDSVKEFLALKKKLANYFDENAKEDIFDYIPPQQTNQIFTPKKIVKDMVDRLEKENPGCFDDESKTFADLYMKSGLYLVEIVKRLYRSERMKMLFPDDKERLGHIFANQVYGLAPTEIIYRIVLAFVLGFNDDAGITKHNIRLCDSLQYAKEGKLEEKLETVFNEPATPLEVVKPKNTVEFEASSASTSDQRKQYSVTQRIAAITQPRGGYINPKVLESVQFEDGRKLSNESVTPTTMGLIVDYMSRFDQGASAEDAFHIGLRGAERVGRLDEVKGYVSKICGLDDESIQNACKITYYDQFVRTSNKLYGNPLYATVDHQTCENVRIMVARIKNFFRQMGPVVADSPVFPGGYSSVVTSGDGDYVTKDTIWDLKVSKNLPTKENTLQLAMYYLMAKRSFLPEYQGLNKIGIFNPRLNKMFTLEASRIPEDVILAIEKDVICY